MKLLSTFFLLAFSTSLALSQGIPLALSDNSRPFVLGVIDEIQSDILSEKRVLNIYLPEGFNKKDTTTYPVIYLLDGSADEDFIHIVGLVHFNTFSWVDLIPNSIVVGIANVDRQRDFSYPTTIAADKTRYPTTGHSEAFMAFIEKELQPYIQTKYKTNSSKTIIGQSLGGLLLTEIILKHPTLFNKYIIISPSLWWDDGSLLDLDAEILHESFSRETDIYIGVGKEGLAPGDNPHVMEVDANILADKIQRTESKNVRVYFDYLPEETHATIMHQAVMNAFKKFYPKERDHRY